MNCTAAKNCLIVSILSLLAVGCTTTPKAVPSSASRMPGTGSISPLPGYPAQARVETEAIRASDSFVGDDYVPDAEAIARVGFFTPAGPCVTSGQSSCGCQGCGGGGGSCSPAEVVPYGYDMTPPMEPWNAYGIDPQEFLCDGGDQSPEVIVRRDDSLAGLDPEDTVVHYTTEAGDIQIQESNRACVYSPRFSSVRKITGAVAGGHAIGLAQVDRPVATNGINLDLPGLVVSETTELGHADVARRIDAMRERNRGVPVESILQLQQATDVLAALVGMTFDQLGQLHDEDKALLQELTLAAVSWTMDESVEVAIEDLKAPTLTRDQSLEGFTIYDFPDAGRLQICKLADRHDARPGDIVTFAIRVENVGDSPVSQVTLTDNLTTRLEYVEESQTCSGGAEFEAVGNQGQSLKLQWLLTDQLRVGESVTIRFQCKVR